MPAPLLDSVLEILARRRFALAEAAAGAAVSAESGGNGLDELRTFRDRVVAEIKRRRAFFEQRQSESLDKRAVEDGEALRYAALTDAMSGLLTFVETL